jgi:signal transduction histidine kinase/FixJ family two-component response regulator
MSAPDLASTHLRILLIEDNADDAALLERHLRRHGLNPEITRVEQAEEMHRALFTDGHPDLVLADYNLPTFSGPAALQLLKAARLDLPFIMLSGEVSEETAVSSMRAGAHDYVSKQNLSRLVPAIRRELQEAETRRISRAAEMALQASEARFHSLVEAMPVGLLICNPVGRIIYGNRSAERMLHYSTEEFNAGAIDLHVVCPALAKANDSLVAGMILMEPFEAICQTRSTTEIEVLIGVAILNPEAPVEGRQLAYFIADLTLQKKSEEVMRRSEKLAIVGRLAASIAHEINNPLEATINCLYLLSQNELPEDARSYLDMAQRELDRVTQITVQTLRFYRSSTRATDTDVHELIETVLALVDSRLRQTGVKLVREFRADPRIFVHEGEIRQVLANLISNALDAIGESGCIVVRTAATRDWKRNRKGLVITVADDGIGMDESTRSRIFEPFFSTKGATGTGLGLWVSHEIAGKHQGRILLRSRPRRVGRDGGTVFRFFLPTLDEGA